jgi:hypothetical protein
MSHRRVDGRGRYGKEYGNSLVQRKNEPMRKEEGLQARVRVKRSLILIAYTILSFFIYIIILFSTEW